MNKIGDRASYLILFLPWLILFAVFTFVMAGWNVFVSFTDWQGILPSYNWVGLKNYLALPSMTGFWQTLGNVGILFGIGLPITVLLATFLSVLMDTVEGRLSGVIRGIAVSTMALGGVTVGVMWSWMFNFRSGGINTLLRDFGLDGLVSDWLGNPDVVMTAVIVMLVWKFVGYGSLVVLGGLQGIPQSHIEAARIDGASTVSIYLKILLPQVWGHILTITLLLSMYLLKTFDLVYVLTGGGPGWKSTLFPILVYRKMFNELDYAGGAATATFMFLIVSVVAIPYMLHNRREE